MRQVLEVVSGSRGVSPEALAEAVHRNNEVFFKKNCRAMRINADAAN
jgi:Tat protein secretion system quality control protein TatD with DNase activity